MLTINLYIRAESLLKFHSHTFFNMLEVLAIKKELKNDASFEAAFKQHFTPLCAYCKSRFNFDLELSKETVHRAFIKLWENWHNLSSEVSYTAYLYKIVTNLCLDIMQHKKIKQKHYSEILQNVTATGYCEAFDQIDVKQLKEDIDTAIAELPIQMRRIFELSRYEGLKYVQIADRLNLSVKTVETQMSRALVKLRSKLSHYLLLVTMAVLYFFKIYF